MYIVADIAKSMEELAPLEFALEWDNVGLQIGQADQNVSSVLVTLTITPKVLETAIKEKVDLIIAHHPLIFEPIKKLITNEPLGNMLRTILINDLALYVSHTNLDQAPQGLNYWLARDVGLENQKVLVPHLNSEVGLGRVGNVKSIELKQLAHNLEKMWETTIRVVGDLKQEINLCAVAGGSGGDFIQQAKLSGADVLITGDVSYHDAIDAKNMGLAVIDAGHFATEKVMVSEISKHLLGKFGTGLKILEEASEDPFYP